jgi:hypothetical protein
MTILTGTTDQFWAAALACSVGHYLNDASDKETLRLHYRDYLDSPVVDKELRALLPALPAKLKEKT